MPLEYRIRVIAGLFVLVTVALGVWVHPAFLLGTAFVGVNLIQSAFTGFCPMNGILRRAGWSGPVGLPTCSAEPERQRGRDD